MARTTNKAESLLTFSRASSGTALTKVAYGPELVTNGTFDTDSDWNKSTNWAISAGIASNDGTQGFVSLSQDIGIEENTTYEVTFTVVSGTIYAVRLGGFTSAHQVGSLVYTAGTYTARLTTPAGSNTVLYITSNNSAGSIDNISVKEVLFNDPTGTLKLISHPTNKPRVEYDANGVAKGLLIEEARTNLVASSLVFTGIAAATPQGMTVTSSLETAPDGTTSASLCTATGTGIHRARHSVTVTASGVAYSTSVFVKNVDADYIQIHNSGDLEYYANFDLVNGVVGTTGSKTTSTITAYPNGWYRITASYDGTGVMNAVSNITIITSASAGFGENANKPGTQVHMWGVQREQGSFPTSYIPTSGATATRSADIASVSVSEFGCNAAQGVILAEASSFAKNYGNQWVFTLNGTGNSDLSASTHSSLQWRTFSSAGTIAYFGDAASIESGNKFAVMYDNIGVGTVADGVVVQPGTLSYTLTDPDMISIGSTTIGTAPLNGHIKSIKYYPVRLDDDKLKELTL